MNYYNAVYHNRCKDDFHKIIRLQERAARVILDAQRRSSSVKLFNKLYPLMASHLQKIETGLPSSFYLNFVNVEERNTINRYIFF